jgi:hypothetical protein
LLTDQLDAKHSDSAYLSSRSSDYFGVCDSDSCSSDGDGSQDGDCDSGSCSSDGDDGQVDTDSGAGGSDDAAAATRAGAEYSAGAGTDRAQACAEKVAKHQANATSNASAAKKLQAETVAKRHDGAVAFKDTCLQANRVV